MSLFLIDFENVHDSGISGINHLSEEDEVCIFYSQKSEHMSFDTHVNIMKASARVQYIKLRKSAKNYLDFQLVTHLGFLIGSKVEGPYYIISKDTGYDSVVDYWREHGVSVTRQPSIGFNIRQSKQMPQPPVQISQNNKALIPAEIETETEQEEITFLPSESTEDATVEIENAEMEVQSESLESEDTATEIEEQLDLIPEDQENIETEQVLMKPDTLPESFRKKVRSALRGKNIPSGNYSAIYKAIVSSYDKLALNNLLVKSFGSSKGGLVYNAIKDIFVEYHSL